MMTKRKTKSFLAVNGKLVTPRVFFGALLQSALSWLETKLAYRISQAREDGIDEDTYVRTLIRGRMMAIDSMTPFEDWRARHADTICPDPTHQLMDYNSLREMMGLPFDVGLLYGDEAAECMTDLFPDIPDDLGGLDD